MGIKLFDLLTVVSNDCIVDILGNDGSHVYGTLGKSCIPFALLSRNIHSVSVQNTTDSLSLLIFTD